MLGKQTALRLSGCLNSWVQLYPSPSLISFICLSRCLSLIYEFIIFSSPPSLLSFSLFYTWQPSQVSAVIVYFALHIELNVICLHKAEPRELPGQCLFAAPPIPHPFTSLIFICARFLSWPWMELSPCSVQLYVYWIYSIVSHCACVSIQETASAFLEEQLLSAQALKREINQLVSSDWFWGGKKKGII